MYVNIDVVGKRYRFSTDKNIIGDEEGLLLTSYQAASEHTAARIRSKLGLVAVAELCSGVGGTTVFLAQQCTHVYAVDIKKQRIEAAEANAKTFKVENKISYLCGDVTCDEIILALSKKGVGAVVTDVEWRDDLSHSLAETTPDISKTIPSTPLLYEKVSQRLSPNIVMHLPANSNKKQLQELGECEIEEMYYGNEIKFINVYFGKLKNIVGTTQYFMDKN